jgi:Uma2 family endonuclease
MDYLAWPEDERWEIINGEAFMMSPSPKRVHQRILVKISTQIETYLQDKTCEIYVAPFDVRFPDFDGKNDEEISTVVSPEERTVTVFTLEENARYGRPEVYLEGDNPEVGIFPGFHIDLSRVFAGH